MFNRDSCGDTKVGLCAASHEPPNISPKLEIWGGRAASCSPLNAHHSLQVWTLDLRFHGRHRHLHETRQCEPVCKDQATWIFEQRRINRAGCVIKQCEVEARQMLGRQVVQPAYRSAGSTKGKHGGRSFSGTKLPRFSFLYRNRNRLCKESPTSGP